MARTVEQLKIQQKSAIFRKEINFSMEECQRSEAFKIKTGASDYLGELKKTMEENGFRFKEGGNRGSDKNKVTDIVYSDTNIKFAEIVDKLNKDTGRSAKTFRTFGEIDEETMSIILRFADPVKTGLIKKSSLC